MLFSNLFDSFKGVGISNFFPRVSILGPLLPGQADMSVDVILPSHLWSSSFSLPQPWSPVRYLCVPPVVHLSCNVSSILPFQSCCSFFCTCDSSALIQALRFLSFNVTCSILRSIALCVLISLFIFLFVIVHVWEPYVITGRTHRTNTLVFWCQIGRAHV